MNPLRMMVVAGTRPELIKLSVFLRLAARDQNIHLIFVHSGQHYDDKMSGVFLRDLDLPDPQYNIEVGSAPNSVQTANIILKLFEIVQKEHPDVILAQGDTNTVCSSSLTAFKSDIPFAHVEAGLRSYDWRMPEEVNRVLTSTCTLLNFAPTTRAALNLVSAGISPNRIFIVGNPIVDAVLQNLEIARIKSSIEKTYAINPNQKLIVVTAHRPANVDNKSTLLKLIEGMTGFKGKTRIIFSVHPRTRGKIKEFGLEPKIKAAENIEIIDPLGYLDFLKLMSLATFIVTDSGGMQEEVVVLKKPCLTLRENTERPETVEVGANVLVGNDPARIHDYIEKLLGDPMFYAQMIPSMNPFGNGTSSEQMISILKNHYRQGLLTIPTASYLNEIPRVCLVHVQDERNYGTITAFETVQDCTILEVFDTNGNSIFPRSEMKLTKGMSFKYFWPKIR